MHTNITYAGKVIAKAQLQKSEQKEKVSFFVPTSRLL